MKLLNNKFTETVILLPIIVFFALASYYLYTSYNQYNKAQESLVYGEYIAYLDNVLSKQGDAQGDVAIYLGMNGKSDYKRLEDQWIRSDTSVEKFNKFLSKNAQYKVQAKDILEALSDVKETRSKIGVLNIKYTDLYIKNYTNNINTLLLQSMKNINKDIVDKEITQLFQIYSNIASFKELSRSERAFTSYLLSRSQIISDSELELWDYYIGKDNLPSYKAFADDSIVTQLDALLKSDKYKKIIKKISLNRIEILSGSDSGDFSLDLTSWYALQSSKIALLEKAQNLIYKYVQESTQADIEVQQRTMSIAAIIIILALLLIFVVRSIFSNMARDTKELQNVLKNIEVDLDDEFNLKEMLKRQSKTEIYRFLEKTIHESNESKRLADEANETKSKFLANMSHEIRTPLNGIVGFTGLLKTTNMDDEQEEFVEIIEKSSENLLAVINDILDLSKIESDKIDIELIPFDPIKEFESGIESYGAKASEKNINLGFYMDPHLSNHLRGDPVRIKQVLVNLISNAVKFTPDDGEIDVLIEKIATENNDVVVRFSVKDSGIGISSEQKIKIFEAFSQADSSTNRRFGGTGLGLTISKTLVELMGGELELESVRGEGSTFFFELMFEEIASLRQHQVFHNFSVAYYLPKNQSLKQADIYIKKYISAVSSNYKVYDAIESLLALSEKNQPELLFVDYDYVSDEELKKLNTLKSEISVLTTVHKKSELKSLNLDFIKIIYAPVNFSKIQKLIISLAKDEVVKSEEYNLEKTVVEDVVKKETRLKAKPNSKDLESIDVLLCKYTQVETNIFNALLNKIGYSVEIAKDIAEVETMILKKNYRCVLIDKDFDNLAESDLVQILNEMSILSLLFVPNLQVIKQSDRDNYTQVVLDVADIQLLRHNLAKLIPLK